MFNFIHSLLLIVTHLPLLDEPLEDDDEMHSVLHRSLTAAKKDTGLGRQWYELAERARGRTNDRRGLHDEGSDEDEGYQLQENDMLWEIGCTVSLYAFICSYTKYARVTGWNRGNHSLQSTTKGLSSVHPRGVGLLDRCHCHPRSYLRGSYRVCTSSEISAVSSRARSIANITRSSRRYS